MQRRELILSGVMLPAVFSVSPNNETPFVRFLPEVSLTGIRPEVVAILPTIASVFAVFGHKVVVTAALDGGHMRNSLHYAGAAIDVDTHGYRADIADMLAASLPWDFDVVAEESHIHIEFQPNSVP